MWRPWENEGVSENERLSDHVVSSSSSSSISEQSDVDIVGPSRRKVFLQAETKEKILNVYNGKQVSSHYFFDYN